MPTNNKVYKIARGYFRDYKPESDHKDMIFLEIDKRLVYLNGLSFNGNEGIMFVHGVKGTENEILSMQSPVIGQTFYCKETHTVYEYTNTGWHRTKLNPGDFITIESYNGDNYVLAYFDGASLNFNYNSVDEYDHSKVNELYYWYEGE